MCVLLGLTGAMSGHNLGEETFGFSTASGEGRL
jgi:hypothetical protein